MPKVRYDEGVPSLGTPTSRNLHVFCYLNTFGFLQRLHYIGMIDYIIGH
jgi:hypothetical protein